MRRISRDWNTLATQLGSAGAAIAALPDPTTWPTSAPTQAQVVAAGAAILDFQTQIIEAENQLQMARESFRQAMEEGTRVMRLVDYTTSALYGETGRQKISFGLEPVDRTRNSPGPTPQVIGLELSDGPGSGAIDVRWRVVPRATFEVQWFSDSGLENLVGAMVATRAGVLIPALPPGAQIWLRVRALRGGRFGAWSATATRIANV